MDVYIGNVVPPHTTKNRCPWNGMAASALLADDDGMTVSRNLTSHGGRAQISGSEWYASASIDTTDAESNMFETDIVGVIICFLMAAAAGLEGFRVDLTGLLLVVVVVIAVIVLVFLLGVVSCSDGDPERETRLTCWVRERCPLTKNRCRQIPLLGPLMTRAKP